MNSGDRPPMIQSHPLFSIIIPTYARPHHLTRCVRALTRLNFPRDEFEVILVDDGSGLQLEGTFSSFKNILDIKLVAQSHAGPAAARNKGAAHAIGKFLVFTDDDCEPAPNWLQSLATCFNSKSNCGVGGRIINRLSDNIFSTTSQMLLDYLYAYYNTSDDHACFFASNNLAFPSKPFHAIGGFDTTFHRAAAEDRELCNRWINQGYQLVYADEVIVYHKHTLNFKSFCKQHFNYGYGGSDFRKVRILRGQKPIKIEPMLFYFNLLLYPWVKPGHFPAIAVSLLLTLSQCVNAAGYLGGLMKLNHPKLVK